MLINMSQDKDTPVIKTEELKELMEQAVMPIDFDDLIEKGIIEKRRGWYKVHDLKRLPTHAQSKVSEVKTTQGETFVKFRAPSTSLAKELKKFR